MMMADPPEPACPKCKKVLSHESLDKGVCEECRWDFASPRCTSCDRPIIDKPSPKGLCQECQDYEDDVAWTCEWDNQHDYYMEEYDKAENPLGIGEWGTCEDCGKRVFKCCGSCLLSPANEQKFYCNEVERFTASPRLCAKWKHFACPAKHKRVKK